MDCWRKNPVVEVTIVPDRREGSGCLVNASSFPRTHTQSRPRWRSWAKASALVRGCACASVKVNKTESHAHTGASKCAQNPRYIKILCACVCVCACVNKQVDTAHKHAQGSLFWMCACVADGFSTNIDMRTHTHTRTYAPKILHLYKQLPGGQNLCPDPHVCNFTCTTLRLGKKETNWDRVLMVGNVIYELAHTPSLGEPRMQKKSYSPSHYVMSRIN